MNKFISLLLIITIPLFTFAQRATITWDGSSSNDWQTASNWDSNAVPISTDDVVIADVTTQPVIDDGSTVAVCSNLTINAGADLTIASNGQMTVSGTLINNAGNSGLVLKAGASLIHSTASVSGTVEVALSGNQWHYVSAPVSGLSDADFSSTDFFYWDASAEWAGGSNTDPWATFTGSLSDAIGYANLEDATTHVLTGDLHQGNFSVTVKKSATGTASDQGYNLLGNPYTSAIDWTLVDRTGSDVDNAIYCYDDANTQYASWVAGTGTNGGTQYIPVGQGFFVKANTDNATLAFANDDRVHNTQSFWKNIQQSPNIIRLIAQGNGYSDEIVIRFREEATFQFDGEYDAYKLLSSNTDVPQIYTMDSLKSVKFSINSLPFINEEIAIPIGFKVSPAGTYSISASEINIDYRYLFLEDVISNDMINLKTNPVYTYSYPGNTNADEDRFILHIIPNSAPICDNPINNLEINEDESFEFVFPENTFSDSNDDALTYFATKQDGSNLPEWLNFSQAERKFSGMPENSDVGIIPISLYALDNYGDTAVSNFDLTVVNVNDAPLGGNIADQVTYTGNEWNFTLAENTFYDIDEGDVLVYSANLVGETSLPTWLSFDADTKTFSGTPETSEIISISVTATDLALESVSDEFDLHIIQTVGIEQNSNNEIIISPNPSTGIFIVNGKNINNIKIVDISGKVIFSKIVDNKFQERINLQNVSKGIYFIKIKTDTDFITKRIIIE